MTSTDIAAPLMVKRRLPVNETVRRLKAIKPGECIRYYRGTTNDFAGGVVTAAYNVVIREAFDCAHGLKLAGRVELLEQKHTIEQPGGSNLFVTDFYAVGK